MVLHEKYPTVANLTELVPLAFQILRFKMLDAHRKSLRRASTIRNRLMTFRLPILASIRRRNLTRNSK